MIRPRRSVPLIAVMLLAGCAGSASKHGGAAPYERQVAKICEPFHRRSTHEHLDVALPNNGPALIRLTARTEALLRDQVRELAAVTIPAHGDFARLWLADQRRLVQLFDSERRAIAAAIRRERRRAAEWRRLDKMRYAEVRALGEHFRPVQLLARAMRARHKQVVSQLPIEMRRHRERQARFYMLNAPDSPVAVAGKYTGFRIYPLAKQIRSLARRVGGMRCPPSDE